MKTAGNFVVGGSIGRNNCKQQQNKKIFQWYWLYVNDFFSAVDVQETKAVFMDFPQLIHCLCNKTGLNRKFFISKVNARAFDSY